MLFMSFLHFSIGCFLVGVFMCSGTHSPSVACVNKYLLSVCRLSSLSLRCLLMDGSFNINVAKCIDLFLCLLAFFVSS